MALTTEMVNICIDTKPDYCCIVPERREELTTEGGLDLIGLSDKKFDFLMKTINDFNSYKIKPSLFIDPEIEQIERSIMAGIKCVELHTGSYADASDIDQKEKELIRIKSAAEFAQSHDIQVHAGHGLNLSNLSNICRITQIEELNIGHSVIADSIFKGFKRAVQDFRRAIDND